MAILILANNKQYSVLESLQHFLIFNNGHSIEVRYASSSLQDFTSLANCTKMRSLLALTLALAFVFIAVPMSTSSSFPKGKTKGRNAAESKISGGGPAQPHAYPFIARVAVGGQHKCGATIADRNYVLTAAHCVTGKTNEELTVVVGDHKISAKEKHEQEIKVKQIYIHHKYQ